MSTEKHIYRVTLQSVEALVKADSMAAARRALSSQITVKRLSTGDLYDAMKRGELVIEHDDQPALPGLQQPETGAAEPHNELAAAADADTNEA